MSSFQTIVLDTTAPILTISSPNYSTLSTNNYIFVNGNEPITPIEIFSIDSEGVRRDYTFSQTSPKKLEGIVSFNNCPLGILTLYVKCADNVLNETEYITKQINLILENEEATMIVKDPYSMKVSDNIKVKNITTTERSRKVVER